MLRSQQPVDVTSGDDPDRRRPRRAVVVAAAALLLVLAAVLVAQRSEDLDAMERAEPTPAAARPPVPVLPSDVTWTALAGMQLPVSRSQGPRCVDDVTAACFSRTATGAAFAAVHLLVRTFPFVGSDVFEPTIARQVVGPHQVTLSRLTEESYRPAAQAAGVVDGGPLESSSSDAVVAYRTPDAERREVESGTARIGVLVRQVDDGGAPTFTEFLVELRWVAGDWRLIAPAWGDWRSAARAVPAPDPDVYRPFDSPGEPPR